MEMTYTSTLRMPAQFAVVNADEMMYVEGGDLGYVAVKFGVNCAVNAFLGGGTISCLSTLIKTVGTKGFETILRQTLIKWVSARIVNSIAGCCSSIITGFASFSVGGAVAEWLDRRDGRNDDHIDFGKLF